jgi:hypothetical protein
MIKATLRRDSIDGAPCASDYECLLPSRQMGRANQSSQISRPDDETHLAKVSFSHTRIHLGAAAILPRTASQADLLETVMARDLS